jgi:hypothetical protein
MAEDPEAANVSLVAPAASLIHVDFTTRLADRDVAGVSAVAPAASLIHVDSFTRPVGAFGLAIQSAYACDTRLAMNCCLCTVRRCHTRRKEER